MRDILACQATGKKAEPAVRRCRCVALGNAEDGQLWVPPRLHLLRVQTQGDLVRHRRIPLPHTGAEPQAPAHTVHCSQAWRFLRQSSCFHARTACPSWPPIHSLDAKFLQGAVRKKTRCCLSGAAAAKPGSCQHYASTTGKACCLVLLGVGPADLATETSRAFTCAPGSCGECC